MWKKRFSSAMIATVFAANPDQGGEIVARACGEVLKDAGELAAAMEMWYHGKNFERAMDVLQRDMHRNMVTERAALYVDIFRDCPKEILKRHIGASFKYAIAAFSAGDFQAFATQMQWLGEHCAALPPDREGDRWRGELHVLLALREFNDIEAMSRHHERALALLDGPTSLYGPDSPWTLGSPSLLFMFYRESGKLKEHLRLMQECMPRYYRLTGYHGAGAEFLMEAEALYNAGDFARAQTVCQKALETAARRNQRGNEFCAMFLQMRLALQAGDAGALFGYGENPGLMADMRCLITGSRNYFLLHTADLCEGWLYASLGLHEKMPGWLRREPGGDSHLLAFAKGWHFIVHGFGLLLAEEYAKVIVLFNGLLQERRFAKNLLFELYAHIWLAAAWHKTDQKNEAASSLKTALDIALPDALHMPFAENYDLIGPLLVKALSGKEHEGVLPRIAALAQQARAGREAVLQKIQSPRQRFGFTEKEYEIALLVAEGLFSEEIKEKLTISDATLKTHLNRIFKKCGIVKKEKNARNYVKSCSIYLSNNSQ